jgi:hypothetical protein
MLAHKFVALATPMLMVSSSLLQYGLQTFAINANRRRTPNYCCKYTPSRSYLAQHFSCPSINFFNLSMSPKHPTAPILARPIIQIRINILHVSKGIPVIKAVRRRERGQLNLRPGFFCYCYSMPHQLRSEALSLMSRRLIELGLLALWGVISVLTLLGLSIRHTNLP